jgi:curved DNA-binding protein CbpA
VFPAAKRRSTRVVQAVPLVVAALDAVGRPLQEQTATLSINCHGCRYFSRHQVEPNTWLTLEIPRAPTGAEPHRLRARVAWVQRSRKLQGLFQVGVEFERPSNVWGLESPPDDWQQFATTSVLDPATFEREMKRLLNLVETGNYYQLLDVTTVATRAQVKRKFHELARKFHPDLHMTRREWLQPLEKLMDAVTLAYKTLSDEAARQKYDRRLAQSGAFALGQSKNETQRSARDCLDRARECLRVKNYAASIGWLRRAVDLDPGSARNHALLARSLAAVPQYRREAVEHYEKAIELDPLDARAQFQFGQLYEEMKLPWRARLHYVRALELDPEHAEARERVRALDATKEKGPKREPAFLSRLLHRVPK